MAAQPPIFPNSISIDGAERTKITNLAAICDTGHDMVKQSDRIEWYAEASIRERVVDNITPLHI